MENPLIIDHFPSYKPRSIYRIPIAKFDDTAGYGVSIQCLGCLDLHFGFSSFFYCKTSRFFCTELSVFEVSCWFQHTCFVLLLNIIFSTPLNTFQFLVTLCQFHFLKIVSPQLLLLYINCIYIYIQLVKMLQMLQESQDIHIR